MHYHNLFLVKADGKEDAIESVEKFLEKFQDREFDWYQFGGRWMWSDLIDINIDKIVKPSTGCYWNKYHDLEVVGKTWEMTYPDNTKETLSYGDEYPIKDWVGSHPELSEVIDATKIGFFKLITHELRVRASLKRWWRKQLNEERGNPQNKYCNMVEYYEKHLTNIDKNWLVESHFWNITDKNGIYNKRKIIKDRANWFLVNVDLHN